MSSKPGKTAPRLADDLYRYDPRRAAPAALTDPPPHYDRKRPPVSAVAWGSCHHSLMIKPAQSKVVELGSEYDGDVFKAATYCRKCRYHFDVLVDGSCCGRYPCLNDGYPLHHFVHSEKDSHGAHYRFRCSAEQCGLLATITLKPPRITREHLTTLMDPHVLDRRYHAGMEIDPERADLQKARPVDPPHVLSRYLRDALNKREVEMRIPFRNRKFLMCFGKDCDQLLRTLGFTRAEAKADEEGGWILPKLPTEYDPLEGHDLHDLIDDARQELQCIVDDEPLAVKNTLTKLDFWPKSARVEIEGMLGAVDYAKKPQTHAPARSEPHPYYASLGAVDDFSDDLLAFAFDRQIAADPENTPYYFECLEGLADGRNSETLDIKRMTLRSQDYFSRLDVEKACGYFNLGDLTNLSKATDEGIISTFQLRLGDTGPSLQYEVREQLRIIGLYRKSQMIIDAATDTIKTAHQAFRYLALEPHITDDWVTIVASNKMGEPSTSETEKAKIKHAVQIIANHRNSETLRLWVETGEMGIQNAMDVTKAYSLFGINDQTDNIDLDVLRTQVAHLTSENPEKAKDYERAVQVIQENAAKGSKEKPSTNQPIGQWPVGIINLGNTCYLNAILQFLYTIRPLRQVVLDFEQYKMDMTPENIAKKKVGERKVTEDEVRRSQDFVQELQRLFIQMRESQQNIEPRRELVRGALQYATADPPAEGLTSTGDSDATLVGDSSGPNGESEKKTAVVEEKSEGPHESSTAPDAETLPDAEPVPEADIHPDADSSTVDHEIPSQDPPSSVTLAASANDSAMDITNDDASQPTTSVLANGDLNDKPPHPDHKPPLPPRNAEAVSAPQVEDMSASRMQQDAGEVMNNVLLQLSYAIRPTKYWNGEQLDQIKDLFYGVEELSLDNKGQISHKLETFNGRLIPVPDGPKNIYEALDDDFDRRSIEGSRDVKKWTVMTRVPPILLINIGRVGFDKEKGGTYKSFDHVDLEDTIYLDRYCSPDDEVLGAELSSRREQAWHLKDVLREHARRLQNLQSSKLQAPLAEVLSVTSKWISGLESTEDASLVRPDDKDSGSLTEKLETKAAAVQAEIGHLEESIKDIKSQLSSMFSSYKSMPYKLHSLFLHAGSDSGGHYWVSIRDFKNNTWRKYNDENVMSVTNVENDIFGPGDRRQVLTSAVYIKADMELPNGEPLVEALHRNPKTTGEEAEMTDYKPAEHKSSPDSFMDATVTEGVDVAAPELSEAEKSGYEAQGLDHVPR